MEKKTAVEIDKDSGKYSEDEVAQDISQCKSVVRRKPKRKGKSCTHSEGAASDSEETADEPATVARGTKESK